MSIVLQSSSGGSVTIAEPTTASNFTQTLPAATGTIANTNQLGNGFRNRIINGNMTIDQRNAGAAVTTNDTFPVDRFRLSFANSTGAFSAQQTTTAPEGFVNSLKYTTTTADASLGATEYAILYQAIEGLNIADLGWGTASAKSVTLSFWVRSSVTGTFGGSLRNSAGNRSYPFTYTISAANTWEYETITIAGDTSGTWLTTNGIGVYVSFGMGVGSTLAGTAGAWAAANYIGATGAVNLIATLSADLYITGVQLELGSTATPFDFRSIGTELALCQRYYETSNGQTIQMGAYGITSPILDTRSTYLVNYKVEKRATPTVSLTSSSMTNEIISGGTVWGTPVVNGTTTSGFVLYTKVGTAAGSALYWYTSNWASSTEL